jgi:hypothetical protein
MDTIYSGLCNHGNALGHCSKCAKEREAKTSAAELDKRERMAFEIYKNAYRDKEYADTAALLAFEAADAFIMVANEMRGKE